MPAPGDDRALALERSAVSVSFWFGGCGLALLKFFAYMATGSILVRTSMFESIGDVISSAIMAVTQTKMNDTRDAHHYPVGKGRFQAIGVLFFCAFMCSSMSSMAIDSFQALLGEEDTSAGAETALRRMFDEKPRLRWAYGGNVDSLVEKYAGSDEAADSNAALLSLILLSVCVVTKALLYFYCRGVEARRASDIVHAVGDDHRNDTMSIAIVIFTTAILHYADTHGWDSPYLAKIDPGISFLLSLWIVYGWVQNALEQIQALSDKRADEESVSIAEVREAAEAALKGTSLQLHGADVYTAGEGFRVLLHLAPAGRSTEGAVEAFAAVEHAVHSANPNIARVDMSVRSVSDVKSSLVKEYGRAVGA